MSDARSNSSEELDEEVLPRGVPNLSGTIVDGRYQVGSILGSGGMGAVFEARHLRLGRRVALKVLKPTLMHRDDYVERFKREARTAYNIRHPNVVEIIDYDSMADGTVYTVMELLVGEDLSSRLKRVGRMSWPDSRWILVQVVRALHAAHAQGVIHRDIKPANCFLIGNVEGQELVKVLDFGIAKLGQLEEGDRALTGTSEILGTPSYMAPEMARGITADARSEVYSVGVLAYRMLGGQVPFDGNNAFDVLLQHATQAPPPLQGLAPHLPAKVVELVHLLLHKDPEARPQNMQEVERLLLSLDDQGQPCIPNPQAVFPVLPSASGSAPIPRGVTGSGIHPTPSGSLLPPPPTPPPMQRDPAARGLTMPPPGRSPTSSPGGSARPGAGSSRTAVPLGKPPAPPLRPPGSPGPASSPTSSGGPSKAPAAKPPASDPMLGTAKTVFAPAPTADRPNTQPPGSRSGSGPGRTPPPAFSKPAPPKLDRPGAPRSPGPPSAVASRRPQPDEPEPRDRTMLAPSPVTRPKAGGAAPPPAAPDSVDRTMIQPSSQAIPPSSTSTLPPPGRGPSPAAAAGPAPGPASAFAGSGVDKTMMVDAPLRRPTATPTPTPPPAYPGSGVDKTMMVDAPLRRPGATAAPTPARPPAEPDAVDRTMIQPQVSAASLRASLSPSGAQPAAEAVDRTMLHAPVGASEDLADRTMIHPPSAAMGGGAFDEDEHRPKRTLMLDDPFAGKPMTDRTMILDSAGSDALELDASDVVHVADGGTQVVELDDATKAAALAAVGIQVPPAGPHGFAPAPNYDPRHDPSGGQPYPGPVGMGQSAPIEVYEEEPEAIGSGRWVMLALVGALVAIGAGGFVAYMLFAGDDTEAVAQADDGGEGGEATPSADDGQPAADDGQPAADDGQPAADGQGTPAAGSEGGDTTPTPEAAGSGSAEGGAEATADDGATAADDGAAADGGAVADDGAAAADDGAAANDDGAAAADDGADDGAAAADDGGGTSTTTKKPPKPESNKPKGPAPDSTVKKRVAKAAAKKCSPTKSYTVSFLIGLGGDLKVPSVSPRDATGTCILDVVRKAKFRSRSQTSREQITVSR